MNVKKTLLLCFFVMSCVWINAQSTEANTHELDLSNCGIIQTKQKLDKRFFASTHPLQLRINNEPLTYATLQLGKRKKKLYLYLKILADNICIKKDKNVDIYFKTGEIITLKNEYPLNCYSFFAKQLKKDEVEKLKDNEITMIKIYTYMKNYELYVSESQSRDIVNQIDCLISYDVKKSDEIILKKKDKKTKNNKK